MSLPPGHRLGSFEVVALLGAGGMGEVYRARDTSLNRDVAVKILPDAFVHDSDRLARFQREAETLAALNHPNIAHIYGVLNEQGARALVMELVEGDTLADRIARGPLPMDDALAVASQVADVLEAAHERGIIHRDLKPANIKVRDDGTVKVLDFGLAKVIEPHRNVTGSVSLATMTSPATQLGVVLGTAAYMAPEQARGKVVDKRADLWAFGCVLFEMLTGRRAFEGDDVAETLGRVLERSPDFSRLPPNTPASILRLLRRCFEKVPRDRMPDAASARLEIKDALAGSTPDNVQPAPPIARRWWLRPLPVAVACLALGIAATLVTVSTLAPTEPRRVSRLEIVLPAGDTYHETMHGIALSHDGRTLVYSAIRGGVQRLFRRELDQPVPTPLAGTEGAYHPFFWPDDSAVGFFTVGPGFNEIKKTRLSGGSPVTVGRVPAAANKGHGGVVDPPDDVIFGTQGGGLFRARGGRSATEPEPVTTAAGQAPHRFPDLLPSGTGIVFTIGGTPAANQIAVLPQGQKEWHVLADGTDARYAPSGHLVFWRDGSLWAAGFDQRRLQLSGEPVPVVDDVLVGSNGRASYTWSRDGTLAYMAASGPTGRTLVWVDRQNKEAPLEAPPGPYIRPELSRTGKQILFTYVAAIGEDIWLHDIDRASTQPLIAERASEYGEIWSPDDRRVVFASRRAGSFSLYVRNADGSGEIEPFVQEATNPMDWTHDGRLIYGSDALGLWIYSPADKSKHPLVPQPGAGGAQVSPDGRWFAYHSAEVGGKQNVFVRPLAAPDTRRVMISTDGGNWPRWSADGTELFYRQGTALMRVAVATAPDFATRGPVTKIVDGPYYAEYDFDAKNQRFLMIKEPPATAATAAVRIIVVQNWFDELKRLVRPK